MAICFVGKKLYEEAMHGRVAIRWRLDRKMLSSEPFL
jgi:hypothetical protein